MARALFPLLSTLGSTELLLNGHLRPLSNLFSKADFFQVFHFHSDQFLIFLFRAGDRARRGPGFDPSIKKKKKKIFLPFDFLVQTCTGSVKTPSLWCNWGEGFLLIRQVLPPCLFLINIPNDVARAFSEIILCYFYFALCFLS